MQRLCRKEVLVLVVVGLGCLVAQVMPDTDTSISDTGTSSSGDADKNKNKENLKSAKLPPCAACKTLVESFQKGIESTARGKFEGGDSAWEAEKMVSYKRSEVRLIEIQEKMCKDVERGQKQCEAGAEEHEGLLEDWWFREQETQPDLHTWLCTDTLRVCCPTNHYGPRCLPCKGGIDNPCSGNGKCKGAGTRKGSGDCSCNPGYKGDMCDSCSYGYYEAYKDDSKLLCEQCHKACNGPCSGPGQKSCVACKGGWLMDTEKGCLDVNECALVKTPCKTSQFCVNNEGTYTCLECDKACNGCTGDGPDMCEKCADGYVLDKDMCVDEDIGEDDDDQIDAIQDDLTSQGQPQDDLTSQGQPQDDLTSQGQLQDALISKGQLQDDLTSQGQPQDALTSRGQPQYHSIAKEEKKHTPKIEL